MESVLLENSFLSNVENDANINSLGPLYLDSNDAKLYNLTFEKNRAF